MENYLHSLKAIENQQRRELNFTFFVGLVCGVVLLGLFLGLLEIIDVYL